MAGKLLLIDDDWDFSVWISTALARANVEIRHAKTLQEASAQLAECPADMVIVDGLLPDGNGMDWIEALRAAQNPIPVFFVSHFYNDARCRDRLRRLPGVRAWDKRRIDPLAFAGEVEALFGLRP